MKREMFLLLLQKYKGLSEATIKTTDQKVHDRSNEINMRQTGILQEYIHKNYKMLANCFQQHVKRNTDYSQERDIPDTQVGSII